MVRFKGQKPPFKSKMIKTPETPSVSSNKETPHFSFEYLDHDYSILNCEKDEKLAFVDTLRIMGKMTWQEIQSAPRHANGTEKISLTQIRGRIPRSIITPDVDHVLAIRFHGMKPMVGHKDGRVFYIIWLDRDFTLYKH